MRSHGIGFKNSYPSPKGRSPRSTLLTNWENNTIQSTDQEHTVIAEIPSTGLLEDTRMRNGTNTVVLKERLNIESGDRFA